MPEQNLGAVDVPHPGQDALVHQQTCDRGATPADPSVGSITSGLGLQGIRAESSQDRVDLGWVEHLARGRPSQVGPVLVDDPPHPQCTAWLGGITEPCRVPPEQSEVYVHEAVAEGREEVLAMGGHSVQDLTIDQSGAGREGSLGAGHVNPFPREGEVLVPGQTMQGMTFGHPEKSATTAPPSRWRSGGEVAQDVGQRTHTGSTVPEFGELIGGV